MPERPDCLDPLIDAHVHLWDLAVRSQPWISGPAMAPIDRSFRVIDLRSMAAASGVTGAVLVETINVPEETPELLAVAATEPLIRGVIGWVDLKAADVPDRVAALRAAPGGEYLAGLRHQVQGEADPRWLCRPDVRRGLAAVADAGLVFDLLVTPSQLTAVVETVAALPASMFVLAHAGKPDIAGGGHAPWAAQISALAAYPNVAVKLSGLVTEAGSGWTPEDLDPYLSTLLTTFGPNRMMWGSDWPVCLLAAGIDAVRALLDRWTAGLTPDERRALRAGTATQVYGLNTT